MPVSSDPNQTVPFWLPTDAAKPMAERPIFICRAMTWREQLKVAALAQEAVKEQDHVKCYQKVIEALKLGVVGWQRMPSPERSIPFNLEAIGDILNNAEVWELIHGYPHAGSLTEADKGKSEGQSPATSKTSAEAAPLEDATSL